LQPTPQFLQATVEAFDLSEEAHAKGEPVDRVVRINSRDQAAGKEQHLKIFDLACFRIQACNDFVASSFDSCSA